MLPLQDDGFVCVSEDLLSLRFNLQLRTMYLEQEMYSADGEVYETILVQKTRTDDGSVWILGPGSFRVIGLSESQMQAPTVILTNESGTSTVQIPTVATVKLEPNDDNVLVLSDSGDDICAAVDLSDISPFPFKSKNSTPSQLPKSPFSHVCNTLVHRMTPSQRPPLHPSPSSIGLTIVDALKVTKSRKRSKSDLAFIDFDNIDVRDVKYLPSSFDGDVLFVLPPVALGVSNTYGRSMDGMDKMCDGHPWCTTKTTNIQNDFGLSFRRSTCAGHLQCPNDYCDYMHRNGGLRNNTEWAGSTPLPFVVGNVAPTRSTIKCKVCRSTPVCIALCPARILYIHSASVGMSRACIHLGVHDHHVSHGTCRESLDMAYQCVASEVLKTPTATNSAIVMAASKQFLADYLLRSPTIGENHHLVGSSLEVVMDKFSTLASPNCRNFVSGSKRFVRSGMGTMDSIMALKDHSAFKFVHGSRFPGQSKDKVFVFKMSVDLPGSGVELVKRMQVGGDMENSWIMFDHVKRLKDWTTMACHVYDSRYCKVLTIACCDMQSEDGAAQTLFWENLNVVMAENGVPKTNFKGFMADSAQANWNAVRRVYGDGDPSLPMVARERTCLFHWSASLDKVTQKYIKPSLQFQHKQICKDYKDAKTMDDAETKYHVIRSWWLSSGAATEEGILGLSEWLGFWHFRYRQWGGHMLLVSTYHTVLFNVIEFSRIFPFLYICVLFFLTPYLYVVRRI